MNKGTMVTLIFLVGLAGLSVSMILGGNHMRCEICIEYNGLEVCEFVEGKERNEMVQLGISTACAGAANGRTESMDCSATPPIKVECVATEG